MATLRLNPGQTNPPQHAKNGAAVTSGKMQMTTSLATTDLSDNHPGLVRHAEPLFRDYGGKLAEENGWAGVVVNGCVRDTAELALCAIGIKAIAAHPKRSDRRGLGETDVVVKFAGLTIAPGEWLYADGDGIVVSAKRLPD